MQHTVGRKSSEANVNISASRCPQTPSYRRKGSLRQSRLHHSYCRVQRRGIRVSSEVPLRSHRQGRGLPCSCNLQAWYCRRLGAFVCFRHHEKTCPDVYTILRTIESQRTLPLMTSPITSEGMLFVSPLRLKSRFLHKQINK